VTYQALFEARAPLPRAIAGLRIPRLATPAPLATRLAELQIAAH